MQSTRRWQSWWGAGISTTIASPTIGIWAGLSYQSHDAAAFPSYKQQRITADAQAISVKQ